MARTTSRTSSTVKHGGVVTVSLDLDWRLRAGDPRITKALDDAVNDTMQACVEHAAVPAGHPNWRNRTFAAQKSVRIHTMAKGRQPGWWGSVGVYYAQYLEMGYGPWLRWAADVIYPTLLPRIKRYLNSALGSARTRAEAATRRRAGY